MKQRLDKKSVKLNIPEAVVVEGRDDTRAVKDAVECYTIETHGFGITKETWSLIDRAYREQGIIIFTDPDHSGEEIRRKLFHKYPHAKHAFLKRSDAEKAGDIGIENACPAAISEALSKAKTMAGERDELGDRVSHEGELVNIKGKTKPADALYDEKTLFEVGLVGHPTSKERRQRLGKLLGIGYANGKGLVARLNGFGINRGDFYEAIRTIDDKTD